LDVATTLNNLAVLHKKQDRLADAEAMYKEALRIRELKLGHESLDVASTLNNLAGLHQKQDRLADAEAMYKDAVGILTQLNPFSISCMQISFALAIVHHKCCHSFDASELMLKCLRLQRSFLVSPSLPLQYRLHLFDARLFAETSCAACKFQLMHDASSFAPAVSQLINDTQALLGSPVATQGTSPYSVVTAARYLLIKAIEFIHNSGHAEAPGLRAEAHERLARLMMAQLAPPPLRAAGRHAAAAVQWTAACDADDLQRRQQLSDEIDAAYVDSHWMVDDDVRTQVDAAVETFHDDVVFQMFADHSVYSSSLEVSSIVRNRVTQLFVQLNCILDQAWGRVVLPLCHAGDAAVYYRGEYSSTLAVAEELAARTGVVRLPLFQISHLQELLSANAAQLHPALEDAKSESGQMFRVCGLPELHDYFTVSDVGLAPPNHLRFSYKPKVGGGALRQQLKAFLEAATSRLRHEELYKDVLSKWLKQFDAAKSFEVSPLLDDKTWITVFVGALQEMGWVSRLKENRVCVHAAHLPADCTDSRCGPLLRFVSEGFVGVLLDWLRKVSDTCFQPVLAVQASAFKDVIAELNTKMSTRLPEGDLLPAVHGCYLFHRQRAIELKCKFDDVMFQSKVEEEESKVAALCDTKDRAKLHLEHCSLQNAAAKSGVEAAFATVKQIQDCGGEALKLDAASDALKAAKAASKLAGEAVASVKQALETADKDFNKATAKGKPLDVARKQLNDANSLQALITRSIEDCRPRSWAALQRSLDCRRYRDEHGQPCGPDEWSKTWSAPLVWISVDNKHVRLTPTLQSSNLKLSTHGFTFADARLTIDYVARRSFYPWTFVRVLSCEGAANAVELSDAVLMALRLERHVVQGRVVHAAAVAYRDAVGENRGASEQQRCKDSYEAALKDLAVRTPQLCELVSSAKVLAAVADVILKKVLQESHLRLVPDFREDALELLQNAFVGTQTLLQEFGREAHPDEADTILLKQRLRTEVRAFRHSKVLDPTFASPVAQVADVSMPSVISAHECGSVRALFEWMSSRDRRAQAEEVLALVSSITRDVAQPYWLRHCLLSRAHGVIQDDSNQQRTKVVDGLRKELDAERKSLLFAGDIDADIHSQLLHCDAEVQQLELDCVLYAGYNDSAATQRGMLQDIESRVVQVCLKLRAVAEQSLMRALEPTVLRPLDDDAAVADGSWDIKFKGGADKVAFCEWLVESNVSLDFVRSCDGTWLTCSSVDGLKRGDAVFFVGDSCGGVAVTDPPTLFYICDVGKSKFSLCASPGASPLSLGQDSSSVMFVCKQPSLPACIQRYPALYNAVEQLFPHKLFASDCDHQHEHEWLHLLFPITNYTKHEELRNVVLPAADAGPVFCPSTPLDGLQLCSVPYAIEGFTFADAARDVVGSAPDAALQLSIAAVRELKRLQVLRSDGRPTGAALPADALVSLIPDGSKRASFVKEAKRVIDAVRVRWLPRHQRLQQPPGAMSAIRRPLMPMLRAAWKGAFEFARVCAGVQRSHFKLSAGPRFQYPELPLELQFMMNPSDATAAADKGRFQLLLKKDDAMVPRTHPHALPFLKGLQRDLRTRLPKYADVKCSTDDVSMSLHVQCSMRGLLQDLFDCVQDSAQHAMPALQQGLVPQP